MSSDLPPPLPSSPPPAPRHPEKRSDYKVAIVCALPGEKDAVDAALDYRVPRKDAIGGEPGDDNGYTFGTMVAYHVVVALLPGIGNTDATRAATNLSRSFRDIKLCLLVGVCAVVPVTVNDDGEITTERLLGHIAISTDILDFDFGRQNEGEFAPKYNTKDQPGRSITKLRNFYADLKTKQTKLELQQCLQTHLEQILGKVTMADSQHPGRDFDHAYESGYIHRHKPGECEACDKQPPCKKATEKSCKSLQCSSDQLIERVRNRYNDRPEIHLGTVGVADLVMKSASSRDKLAKEKGVIAFEMESVGLWDEFPTVVVKGGCAYGDSHKNKKFQPYASATAAACAKAFLELYDLRIDIDETAKAQQTSSQTPQTSSDPAPSRNHNHQTSSGGGGTVNSGPFSGGTWNATNIVNAGRDAHINQKKPGR